MGGVGDALMLYFPGGIEEFINLLMSELFIFNSESSPRRLAEADGSTEGGDDESDTAKVAKLLVGGVGGIGLLIFMCIQFNYMFCRNGIRNREMLKRETRTKDRFKLDVIMTYVNEHTAKVVAAQAELNLVTAEIEIIKYYKKEIMDKQLILEDLKRNGVLTKEQRSKIVRTEKTLIQLKRLHAGAIAKIKKAKEKLQKDLPNISHYINQLYEDKMGFLPYMLHCFFETWDLARESIIASFVDVACEVLDGTNAKPDTGIDMDAQLGIFSHAMEDMESNGMMDEMDATEEAESELFDEGEDAGEGLEEEVVGETSEGTSEEMSEETSEEVNSEILTELSNDQMMKQIDEEEQTRIHFKEDEVIEMDQLTQLDKLASEAPKDEYRGSLLTMGYVYRTDMVILPPIKAEGVLKPTTSRPSKPSITNQEYFVFELQKGISILSERLNEIEREEEEGMYGESFISAVENGYMYVPYMSNNRGEVITYKKPKKLKINVRSPETSDLYINYDRNTRSITFTFIPYEPYVGCEVMISLNRKRFNQIIEEYVVQQLTEKELITALSQRAITEGKSIEDIHTLFKGEWIKKNMELYDSSPTLNVDYMGNMVTQPPPQQPPPPSSPKPDGLTRTKSFTGHDRIIAENKQKAQQTWMKNIRKIQHLLAAKKRVAMDAVVEAQAKRGATERKLINGRVTGIDTDGNYVVVFDSISINHVKCSVTGPCPFNRKNEDMEREGFFLKSRFRSAHRPDVKECWVFIDQFQKILGLQLFLNAYIGQKIEEKSEETHRIMIKNPNAEDEIALKNIMAKINKKKEEVGEKFKKLNEDLQPFCRDFVDEEFLPEEPKSGFMGRFKKRSAQNEEKKLPLIMIGGIEFSRLFKEHFSKLETNPGTGVAYPDFLGFKNLRGSRRFFSKLIKYTRERWRELHKKRVKCKSLKDYMDKNKSTEDQLSAKSLYLSLKYRIYENNFTVFHRLWMVLINICSNDEHLKMVYLEQSSEASVYLNPDFYQRVAAELEEINKVLEPLPEPTNLAASLSSLTADKKPSQSTQPTQPKKVIPPSELSEQAAHVQMPIHEYEVLKKIRVWKDANSWQDHKKIGSGFMEEGDIVMINEIQKVGSGKKYKMRGHIVYPREGWITINDDVVRKVATRKVTPQSTQEETEEAVDLSRQLSSQYTERAAALNLEEATPSFTPRMFHIQDISPAFEAVGSPLTREQLLLTMHTLEDLFKNMDLHDFLDIYIKLMSLDVFKPFKMQIMFHVFQIIFNKNIDFELLYTYLNDEKNGADKDLYERLLSFSDQFKGVSDGKYRLPSTIYKVFDGEVVARSGRELITSGDDTTWENFDFVDFLNSAETKAKKQLLRLHFEYLETIFYGSREIQICLDVFKNMKVGEYGLTYKTKLSDMRDNHRISTIPPNSTAQPDDDDGEFQKILEESHKESCDSLIEEQKERLEVTWTRGSPEKEVEQTLLEYLNVSTVRFKKMTQSSTEISAHIPGFFYEGTTTTKPILKLDEFDQSVIDGLHELYLTSLRTQSKIPFDFKYGKTKNNYHLDIRGIDQRDKKHTLKADFQTAGMDDGFLEHGLKDNNPVLGNTHGILAKAEGGKMSSTYGNRKVFEGLADASELLEVKVVPSHELSGSGGPVFLSEWGSLNPGQEAESGIGDQQEVSFDRLVNKPPPEQGLWAFTNVLPESARKYSAPDQIPARSRRRSSIVAPMSGSTD